MKRVTHDLHIHSQPNKIKCGAALEKRTKMELNQIKIVDEKLFLDDTEIKGIQKINLQKDINGYKTFLKIEMIVESALDELDSKCLSNN